MVKVDPQKIPHERKHKSSWVSASAAGDLLIRRIGGALLRRRVWKKCIISSAS